MKRFLVALLGGMMVVGAVLGAAAALDVEGGTIQAGTDDSLTCSTGVTVLGYGLETDDGSVGNVRLDGLADCAGNDLFVSIKDAAGVEITRGSISPLGPAPWNVPFDSRVAAVDIEEVEVFIEGPVSSPEL